MKLNKKTRNTLILIGIIVIASLGFLYYQRVLKYKFGDYAVISSDGKEIMKLNLDKDTTVTVDSPDGGYNIIEVKNHSICVKESDCENQTCVMQGKIKESYELIVCLPHLLIITIEE